MGGGGNGAEWREGHGVDGHPDCITPTVSTSHISRTCGLLKLLILSLTSISAVYRSHVNYKQRLLNIGLLPSCHWHEFLDLVQVFKCLDSLDPFISVMNSTRPRRTVSSKGTLLNTIRANTVTALRTVSTVEPQETRILYQPTSGTLTVQQRTSRKIFLITTFISLSLFMMSTPPRRLRVCVLSATLVGH